MKKILTLLIILVMVLSLFTSCQRTGSSSSSGKTRVELWGHVNESWNASYRNIIGRYNASQTIAEVVPTFFPWDEFEAKIQTSLLAGAAGADLYEIWGGWAIDFVEANALTEVPSSLMNEIINDCYEPVLGTLRQGNTYFGVPLEFNNEYGGMLVNKPRFQQLGIQYPTTWDQVIDVAKRTTVRRGDIFDMRGLEFCTEDTLCATFLSMIMSNGGQYWTNNRLNFRTPQAIAAMTTLVNWITVDRITNIDSATMAEGVESWEFMGRGEAMMVPRGPWVIAELEHEYDMSIGTEFDFVAFPFQGPTKAFPADTGWSMCVPKASRVADAAWAFVRYFLEPANLIQHNIACAQIPPRKSVATNPTYVNAMPFMAPILEILDYGKFIGPFNSGVLKANLTQVFISLCTNDGTYASVEAALAALESQTNAELRL